MFRDVRLGLHVDTEFCENREPVTLYRAIQLHYVTLHQKTIYSGLSKSNFKDHYGDVVITQCLGKIAEINEFSAADEML